MWEITPMSASIRQPHWHRHLDVKRPTRAVEELHQVAATRTERRLLVKVYCPRLGRGYRRGCRCVTIQELPFSEAGGGYRPCHRSWPPHTWLFRTGSRWWL